MFSRNTLKSTRESRQPCQTPTEVLKNSPIPPPNKNCTVGAVIQRLDDLDQVLIEVVISHDLPQSFLPHSVKGLLVINEVVVNLLFVLQVFLYEQLYIEDLLNGASTWSESCLFFCKDLFHLWFQSVQGDA